MKRNLTIAALTLILPMLIFPLPADAAQTCKDSVLATSSNASFVIHDDGTVTDNTTGLLWLRCSLGQKWDGSNCSGTATGYTWVEGLKTAAAHEFAGHTDWRLPNKNELESIVEAHCAAPAINSEIFPDTPAAFFWTSSPYAGQAQGAWSVDFSFGTVNASVKTGKNYLRLVRNAME